MRRKRFTPEDIIGHLCTVEIETGKGVSIRDACRKLSICGQTYYRWKREYGGWRVDQVKRLKNTSQEISGRLAPRKAILQKIAKGNF